MEPEDQELRTPDEWMQTEPYKDWTILDPDGWDRTNFEEDWARPITYVEFANRFMHCTIIGTAAAQTPWSRGR